MITQQKTSLFVRSSSVAHCVQLFDELKQRAPARWIWIVQPAAAESFRESWRGVDVEIWAYDLGTFTSDGLRELFLSRLRDAKIDSAYVPFNNPEGRGYASIIRFLHAGGVRRILAHTPQRGFERTTPWRHGWRHFIGDVAKGAASAALLLMIPLIVLYYLCAYAWARVRRRAIPA